MSSDYKSHYSVLNKEVIDFFMQAVPENGQFADLTFGAGGHTLAIAKSLTGSKVTSFDQDPDALANGRALIQENSLEDRISLIDSNFEHLKSQVEEHYDFESEAGFFDGIVADLGVSSHHFDESTRGFSFRFDGPLDMRMNSRDDELTAKDVVNNWSEAELEHIIRVYGEEKFTKSIVRNILSARAEKEVSTTKELEDIIFHSYPKKLRFEKRHPATKTFQALRIAVNREMDVLESVIPQALSLLKVDGVLAIITFHSLEDRIVKHAFKKAASSDGPFYEVLTKKPVYPGEAELEENLRSRSAKLRVIKRVAKKKSKNKYSQD
jgi:16S rRNA (cytosine1402-N4)-methyltransferase